MTLAAAFFLALVAAGPAASPGVTDASAFEAVDAGVVHQLLLKGELLSVEEGGAKPFVTAGILIRAPREKVFAALTDYDRFGEFFPNVDRVRTLGSFPGGVTVEIQLSSDFAFLPISFHYVADYFHHPSDHIGWKIDSGDVRESSGSWSLLEAEGGRATIALYRIYFDVIPRSHMLAYLVEYITKKQPLFATAIQASQALVVVKAVKRRVEGVEPVAAAAPPPERHRPHRPAGESF